MSARYIMLVVLLLPGYGLANDRTAIDWIRAMSESMRNSNYQGNFVYMHNNQLESMSISHVKDDSGEKERLLSLNGEAREVIRDNRNLTCIWPSSRKVVVDYSRNNSFSPIFIPDDIERISRLYDIQLRGKDRIAGHHAVIVDIKSKDDYRYGFRFWIDVDTALMLKSSLIAKNNRVIEQVMFTNIDLLEEGETLELNDIPAIDDSFTMVQYHSGKDSGETVEEVAWQFSKIPAGFKRESILKRQDAASGLLVHQMVYSDGLASLSVFIEQKSSLLQQGRTSMGAVNAFIRVLNNHSVTAIGEVPAVTVQQMAEAIFLQTP